MPKDRLVKAIDIRRAVRGASAPVSVLSGGSIQPISGSLSHSSLLNLGADDHTQYFNSVRGDLRYAQLAINLIAGAGLTGGGDLSANRTFDVGAGAGITVNANDVSLTTPGTLTALTSNMASGNHTHALTSSYDVSGAAVETLLKSNAAGGLTVNQLVAGGAGAKVRTPLIDTAAGNLSLAPAGVAVSLAADKLLMSAHYVSAATGWGITYDGAADFRYINADELAVKIFTAVLEQAQAGRFMVAKSVAELAHPFTAPAAGASAFLYVRDLPGAPDMAVFESDAVIGNSDYVSVHTFSRASGGLTITSCYGRVQLVAGDTGPGGAESGVQKWTFSRSAGTIGANNPPGAMAAGTVVAADGSLAIDWGRSGDGYVETSAVDGPYNTRNSPYTQVVTWTGDPVTGRAVRARLGNLRGVTGVTEYGLWAGEITAGNVLVTGDKVALRQGTADRIVLDSAGDSYFAGVMTIGTAGEIRQGTGSLGSNYTGLRIWRDTNVGRIGGYNNNVLQWYGATDGKFYYGAGNGVLDANGISIAQATGGAWARASALSFTSGSSVIGDLQFRTDGGSGRWRVGWTDPGAGDAYIEALASSANQYLYLYGGNDASLALGGNPGTSESLCIITAASGIGLLGPVTANSTVTLSAATPLLTVGGAAVTTGDARVEIGTGRTGNGNAYVDLVATNDTYTDYSARLIRYAGKDGGTTFVHRGTGDLVFYAQEAAQFRVATNGTNRITVLSTGEVGIGKSPTSGVELDVNGDIVGTSVKGRVFVSGGYVPASMTDAGGTLGEISNDGTYGYWKIADSGNRWRRWTLATW